MLPVFSKAGSFLLVKGFIMDVLSIFKGALSFDVDEKGFITPYRFTKKQLAVYDKKPNGLYARATGGIFAEFYTDEDKISFSYSVQKAWTTMFEDSTPTFDIFENGVLTDTKELSFEDKGAHTISYACESKGEKKLCIVFPANAMVSVGNFKIGSFREAEFSKKSFLVLGDSISQGLLNNTASNNYPFLLRRFLDADFVNQGVGGDGFFSNALDTVGFTPDFIIIELGTNDMAFVGDIEKTKAHIKAYFKRFCELYPKIKTYVISPAWLSDEKENKAKSELLSKISDEIKSTARAYGFELIDGRKLVPHHKRYYSDDAHPNNLGFAHLSLNLIKHLKEQNA